VTKLAIKAQEQYATIRESDMRLEQFLLNRHWDHDIGEQRWQGVLRPYGEETCKRRCIRDDNHRPARDSTT
jgi:hypothetical protein